MPGSVPWLGCKGQGHVRQEGCQGGDGHHLSRVDGRESRWLCVKSGPGRSGMQGPSRRPGVKDSVAPMVGGAGAAELWVPGGFLTGGGHQGRCRAILRPGAGSRVDPARWAASPSRFLPHPEGRACHFSPRPSWPPPSLPVPLSGPLLTNPSSLFRLESLLLDYQPLSPQLPAQCHPAEDLPCCLAEAVPPGLLPCTLGL